MSTYTLTAPMIITSRLMPGARISDSVISIEPVIWDGAGYTCAYYIDGPDGPIYSAQDISVALIAGESLEVDGPRKGLATLLSFLGAAAEEYRSGMAHRGDAPYVPADGWLFDEVTSEWAYMMSDEIDMLKEELEPSE